MPIHVTARPRLHVLTDNRLYSNFTMYFCCWQYLYTTYKKKSGIENQLFVFVKNKNNDQTEKKLKESYFSRYQYAYGKDPGEEGGGGVSCISIFRR